MSNDKETFNTDTKETLLTSSELRGERLAYGEETPMNALAAKDAEGNHNLLSRRTFLHSGIVGFSGLALAGCFRGVLTRNDTEIIRKTLTIPNLPAAFKGKTVTLISDIHSSPFMSLADMKDIVRKVNALGSDMIVMPGDFVTSHHNEIPPFVEAMSELRAPMGIYGCLGNHDFYAGADLVSAAVEDIGIKLLRNENLKLTIDSQDLYLLGVDDDNHADVRKFVDGKKAPHIEATFQGVPDNAATILLCHKPYSFDEYAQTKVGLMLSGHTHGGQIVIANLGRTAMTFSTLASQYVAGLYEPPIENSPTKLYVSRGLGVVGLPLRVNCPPEITQITLA